MTFIITLMGTINRIELLEQCKQGDKAALGLLYTTYSRQMMRIVCHYIPDLSAAQDILHDGFLVIFCRINQLRDAGKLEYWMGTIMKNLALQYLKGQDITQLLDVNYDTPDIPAFGESITMEELEVMINRLPMGYRKVFKLAVLEDKSHKEIAKLLGISEQTSGSQLFHARAMLRKMIVEYKKGMGFSIFAVILTIGIFLRYQNTHRAPQVITSLESTKSRIVKNAENVSKAETNIKSIKQIVLSNSIMPAVSTNICSVDKEDTVSISVEAESLVTETNTSSEALVDTIKNNILLEMDNKMADLRHIHYYKHSPANQRGNNNFSLSVGGSAIGALNTEKSYLKPSDNPIWAGNNDKLIEECEHDFPITFALNISKTFYQHWSLESGIQYTLLRTKRTMTTVSGGNSISVNHQRIKAHYLGVPLRLRYKVLSFDKFSLSAGIGEMVEFPLQGKVNERTDDGKQNQHQFSLPIQWSVYGGIGIEYHLSPNIGIYAEPSVNYYFKSKCSYPTIRQDKPFDFSLPVGLRFTW